MKPRSSSSLTVPCPSSNDLALSMIELGSQAGALICSLEHWRVSRNIPSFTLWMLSRWVRAWSIVSHQHLLTIDFFPPQTRMQILPSLTPSALLAQTPGAAAAAGTSSSSAALSSSSSLFTHLRHASTTQSLRTLWRGVASVIMGAGPAHAMHFGTYEFVKEVAGGDREGLRGVGGTALAGAMATTASDAFMNPFDGGSRRVDGWKSGVLVADTICPSSSHQTTNADLQLVLPHRHGLCQTRSRDRRSSSVLHLLSYHPFDEHSSASRSILGL